MIDTKARYSTHRNPEEADSTAPQACVSHMQGEARRASPAPQLARVRAIPQVPQLAAGRTVLASRVRRAGCTERRVTRRSLEPVRTPGPARGLEHWGSRSRSHRALAGRLALGRKAPDSRTQVRLSAQCAAPWGPCSGEAWSWM